MKKWSFILLSLIMIVAFFSCGSLPGNLDHLLANKVVDTVVDKGSNSSSNGSVSALDSNNFEFRSGEVLCGKGNNNLDDKDFYLASIVTPASSTTKNQAEVLYIADGKKAWVDVVLATHKASKEEMKKNLVVVYNNGSRVNPINSLDEYRTWQWETGRITNTDELYKDLVEIKGNPVHVSRVRIIDAPVIK